MLKIDPNAKHAICFNNVTKNFGTKNVLKEVSFNVDKNEIISIIGASGAGKSTILKLICGLIESEEGEILLSSNKKGMAFQFGALLNFLTVRQNVALPLKQKTKLSKKEINKRVKDALASVAMEGTEHLYPAELSGGMQKRVSFARAVVNEPDIILYDEPTSGLDPITKSMIINDICHIKQSHPAAGIIVTHDLTTIEKATDKVILLYNGEIVFTGTPQELKSSDNPYAKQFYHGDCKGPMLIYKN